MWTGNAENFKEKKIHWLTEHVDEKMNFYDKWALTLYFIDMSFSAVKNFKLVLHETVHSLSIT